MGPAKKKKKKESKLPSISIDKLKESSKRKEKLGKETFVTNVEAQEKLLREKVSKVSVTIPAMTETIVVIQEPIGEAKAGNGNQEPNLPPPLV